MKHNFDEIIDRTGTYSTQWDYTADRFGRSDVLPFSISDTDFKAPKEVVEKVVEVAKFGIYGYSRWNNGDFQSAIKYYYEQRHSTDISKCVIAYSPSVMYSIAKFIEILSPVNGSVATFSPMYDAFYKVIQENGRILNDMPLKYTESGYIIDWEIFELMIAKSNIFLLCSPHNPTGKVWTKDEIIKMVNICERNDVWIISDEIHADVILKGKHTTILDNDIKFNKIVLVSSASKTFNTASLGGSYVISNDNNVMEEFMNITRNAEFVNSPSISAVHALISSYTESLYYIDELVSYIQSNFLYVKSELERMFGDKLELDELNSTYLVWMDVSNFEMQPEEIYDVLVNEANVGIMKGDVYGDKNFLRLNIGAPKSKLIELIQRLELIKDKIK